MEALSVEQVQKNPTGQDKRLNDIPAITIFVRMYTATASALKTAVDRAEKTNIPDMYQKQVGTFGNGQEVQDYQLTKAVAALVKSGNQIHTAAKKLSKDGSSIVFRAVQKTGVAD